MPKKFKGENSKAAEARARKEAVKVEEAVRKQKAVEDEYWRDDDKHVMRKQQRKVCDRIHKEFKMNSFQIDCFHSEVRIALF